MQAAGIRPDDSAVAMLVIAHGEQGRCAEAVQTVLKVEAGGQKPGVHTFTALISVFGKAGLGTVAGGGWRWLQLGE